MKYSADIFRRLHWVQLPGAFLIALLQRTPVLRVVETASDFVLRSPAASVLKAAVASFGAMGAVHSLAGATTLSASSPSPTSATVGTTKTVVFSAIGAQSSASSWTVGGSVPPGLSFNGGKTSGTVNTSSPTLLTLTGIPTTAGTYVISLRAWEKTNAGGAGSPTFSYTVNVTGGAVATAPAFTTQPSAQTVTAGGSATFTVAASGSPTPTYQWQKNGGALGGQTGPTLSLSNVQAADAGSYACVATNSAGSATSSAATLTVNAAAVAPAFTTQPSAQTVTAGGAATFTVAASGSPTPTYQWQKNGGALGGQTGPTLSLSNVQAADAGSYTCVATNSAGSATSSAATLTVSAAAVAPAFTTQPSAQTVAPAASATFTVAASGTPTPTYQWRKDGGAIAGQTGPTLSLSNVQVADAGSYTCVATNSAGSATSSAATLTVSAVAVAPAFTTQPAAQSAVVGATVTLTIAASGTPTPTYQWQKNGAAIGGQTGTTLSLSNVQVADAGSYTCVATNSAGSMTSAAAALTVGALPVFSTQPVAQSASVGAAVTFTVAASGTPAPTYQWRKDGTAISGQTGTTLSLGNVQVADAGSYTCVATNPSGATVSFAAALTVSALPVFTTQPVAQSVLSGTSVAFVVATSGSPAPTYQWRKNGSALAGQTGTTLSLSNVQTTDAGSYTCVATNSAGSTISSAAALTVSAAAVAPAFTTQPSSQTVTAGASASFVVAASGTPTPTYQWRKDGSSLAGQTGSTLTLNNAQSADAGSYTCVASNSAGVVTSAGATLTVAISSSAPMFTTQPGAQTANAGGSATFSVVASGSPAPTYQWLKDGVAMAGETSASLTLANVQAAAAGSYTCTATNSAGTATSSPATLAINAAAVQSVISNVSVRTTLEASQTLIVGFTMQGGAKSVLVRAVGPGLANFGVAGAMFDPRLALYRGSDMLMQNDDWGGGAGLSNAFSRVGAFPLIPASHDAAVMRSVEGGHTVQITGIEGGNVLVEAYDAGTGTAAHLVNVSARNRVGTGGDILIAGFTIGGTGPRNLLVRAVGPTLAAFGVPGTLVAPKLEIYNTAGEKIAENDGWAAALASAFSSVGAFPLTAGSHDAALTISLPPGGYTVQVAGADGGTGEALVELYELP